MGQGTSSDFGDTESTEDKNMIKIKVVYYAFTNTNFVDESKFDFQVELLRDEWLSKFTNNTEYLQGMLCNENQDDLKDFIKAFVSGRVKEVRHLEITSIADSDNQLGKPLLSPGNFLYAFSTKFNDFIKKARMIFEAMQMIIYDHVHVPRIPNDRILFNSRLVPSQYQTDQKTTIDLNTHIVSLIAPLPLKQ